MPAVPPVESQFKPGQSGNPSGRPKSKPFKEALLRALQAAGGDRPKLDFVAAALFAKACEGDVSAIRELADRIDGKVPQGIENGDDGALRVHSLIEQVIVKASNQDG